METNRIELSGTISSQIWQIKTKNGAMAKFLLSVAKSRFWIIAFGNIAQALFNMHEGDALGVSGTGQINSWQTDSGDWRNDFQLIAWCIEVGGTEIKYEKAPSKPVKAVQSKSSGKAGADSYADTAPSGADCIF